VPPPPLHLDAEGVREVAQQLEPLVVPDELIAGDDEAAMHPRGRFDASGGRGEEGGAEAGCFEARIDRRGVEVVLHEAFTHYHVADVEPDLQPAGEAADNEARDRELVDQALHACRGRNLAHAAARHDALVAGEPAAPVIEPSATA